MRGEALTCSENVFNKQRYLETLRGLDQLYAEGWKALDELDRNVYINGDVDC